MHSIARCLYTSNDYEWQGEVSWLGDEKKLVWEHVATCQLAPFGTRPLYANQAIV